MNDWEIPQTHTAAQQMASRGRVTDILQLQCIRNAIKVKQPALSLLYQGHS